MLRELTTADAAALLEHICSPEVVHHIATPPQSEEAFRDFIHWTHTQRDQGRHICFGIVPRDSAHVVGIMQVWPLESGLATAEWGFVMGSGYWGTGVFAEAAELLLGFVFGTLGVHRLEARSAVLNARGNSALRRLGATAEGILRGDSSSRGHVMWSLLAEDWRQRRQAPASAHSPGAA